MPHKDPEVRRTYNREQATRLRAQPGAYERYRRAYIKCAYGLTPEQFSAILSHQGWVCGICETAEPGGKGMWHIDHDHDSQEVRGLLCTTCNLGIGALRDDPVVCRKAAEYLEAPPTRTLGESSGTR